LFADDHTAAKDIDTYCREIEDTALWGGEMEITSLSRAFNVPVEIYSDRSLKPMIIEPGSDSQDKGGGVIRLAYYQHLFGLGQHYNGLMKDEK
jgi:OTU domain-containing protein 6